MIYCCHSFSFRVSTTCRVVGGQSRKMAKPILGRGLAMRCERSEHGKSQLSIKYFCTILIVIVYHLFFRVSPSCQQRSVFFASQSHCASSLAPNVAAAWRGRRFTEAQAGAKPAKLHKGFCGLHRLSRQTARYRLVSFVYLPLLPFLS